jgi:pimeloyl-ACP methyl ester carboxylesterase
VLWDQLGTELVKLGYSLFEDLPEIEIPVCFVVGWYDYQTPAPLTEERYTAVKAPIKELIWFKESAHLSIMVEPEKMTRELIRISREIINK